MSARLAYTTVFALHLFWPIAANAGGPGRAVIVNQSSQTVTMDVVDRSGNATAFTAIPGDSVALQDDVFFRVTIRESGFKADVVASPAFLNERRGSANISQPTWQERVAPVPGTVLPPVSLWSTRRYTVRDVDGRLELRAGFSDKDVDNAVARYKRQMTDFGFAPEPLLVYSPYLGRRSAANNETDDSVFAYGARELQHLILADAILAQTILGDRDPPSDAANSDRFFDTFAIYSGMQELGQMDLPWNMDAQTREREFAPFNSIIRIDTSEISSEVHLFARSVAAALFLAELKTIGLVAGRPLIAAYVSGPSFLVDRLAKPANNISIAISGELKTLVNDSPFFSLLTFSPISASFADKEYFGKRSRVLTLATQSEWRIHGIADNVVGIARIKAIDDGMDLRWRVVVQCLIGNPEGGTPTLDARVTVQVQTKRGGQGGHSYKDWPSCPSPFVIEPVAADVKRVDLTKEAFRLQRSIDKRCSMSGD